MARVKKEKDVQPEPAGNTSAGNMTAGEGGGKPMSQREAVKRAMQALGKTASNQDVLSYIEQNFAMTLKRQNVATLKSQIKAEGRRSRGSEGYSLDDLQIIQGLVHRIGASRVRDMVDLFDK